MALAPAADGRLWFTDEGSAAAFGSVDTGMPAAGRVPPRIAATPHPGAPAVCEAGHFATWAGLAPSVNAFGFDGFRWLRNGVLLRGHAGQSFTPAVRDSGARLACRETVTYPPPLNVTVSVTSPVYSASRATGGTGQRRSEASRQTNSTAAAALKHQALQVFSSMLAR